MFRVYELEGFTAVNSNVHHNYLARKASPSIQSFVEYALINLPDTICKIVVSVESINTDLQRRVTSRRKMLLESQSSMTFLAAFQFSSLIEIGAPRRTTLSTSSAVKSKQVLDDH